MTGVSAIDVPEKNGACIDLLLQSERGVPVQVTNSTLMPLSMGVQSRIEATFEHAALVYTETSWCKDGNMAQTTLYDNEKKQPLALPEANAYTTLPQYFGSFSRFLASTSLPIANPFIKSFCLAHV